MKKTKESDLALLESRDESIEIRRTQNVVKKTGMARNNQQQKQMYKNVVWYLIVLAVCYLPDRLTMVLNLLGKLDLDAELCHTWAWKHIVI